MQHISALHYGDTEYTFVFLTILTDPCGQAFPYLGYIVYMYIHADVVMVT